VVIRRASPHARAKGPRRASRRGSEPRRPLRLSKKHPITISIPRRREGRAIRVSQSFCAARARRFINGRIQALEFER
jgi:hypothetical protein